MNYKRRHRIKINRHTFKRARRGRSTRSKGRAWKRKSKKDKVKGGNKYAKFSRVKENQ